MKYSMILAALSATSYATLTTLNEVDDCAALYNDCVNDLVATDTCTTAKSACEKCWEADTPCRSADGANIDGCNSQVIACVNSAFIVLSDGTSTTASSTAATTSAASESCNPAHQYPEGTTCDPDTLKFVYATTASSAAATSTAAPCNPAHQYPEGVTCDPDTLTFVYASTASSAAATSTAAPCNPAHQYPEGVTCDPNTLTFIYGSSTTLATAAATSTGSAYACNPAHQYPAGVTCDPTTLTLVYATATNATVTASNATITSAPTSSIVTAGAASNGLSLAGFYVALAAVVPVFLA